MWITGSAILRVEVKLRIHDIRMWNTGSAIPRIDVKLRILNIRMWNTGSAILRVEVKLRILNIRNRRIRDQLHVPAPHYLRGLFCCVEERRVGFGLDKQSFHRRKPNLLVLFVTS
jgi:hypothetical protein